MADVQQLFERFHQDIRTYYEINEKLHTKKNIIVGRVQDHLRRNERPGCDEYIQGSYKMKVGILALSGSEYDIDVGLRFPISESEHTALEVRRWVMEAVANHTEDVEEKGPCIRVTYKDGYHVDLVCYARWQSPSGDEHRLAHRSRGWCAADPPKLVDHVRGLRKPFEGTEDANTSTDQFRRVVRYLKRWNDNAIRGESDEKPSGLALVLLTAKHLTAPARDWRGAPEDRLAVQRVADGAANTAGRITAYKPTPEYEDLFGRLSGAGMEDLKDRFARLGDALRDAERAKDAKEACGRLKQAFGDDFPCPAGENDESREALRTSAPAIVPSSTSAR